MAPGGRARRADIDGLRAIAVVAVLLFHLDIPHVRGGFVGVDVFFVVSGYVITLAIEAEFSSGAFTFAGFIERRLRRLFPAALAMALLVSLAATILLPPPFLVDFAKSLLAMATSTSNVWFYNLAGDGYFDRSMADQLLLHSWSLAIEEQFYLLLPPAFLLLRPLSRRWFVAALALTAALSFWRAAVLVGSEPQRVFYLLPYRAWELLAGVLLALVGDGRVFAAVLRRRWLREAAALLGLAAIVYAVLSFSRATTFPGPTALVPCAGACLLIAAGAHGETIVGRGLSLRGMVFVGLISYSLYLWHWPVIVFAGALQVASVPLVLAVTILYAVLSWRFVETPFRQRRLLSSRRPLFASAAVGSAIMVAVGGALWVGQGWPGRLDPAIAARIAANEVRTTERSDYACLNVKEALSRAADMHKCTIAGASPRKVLFWGDSHVAQLRPLVADLAADHVFGDRTIQFATAGGCVPAPDVNRPGYRCASFGRIAEGLADAGDVDVVFLGFSAYYEATWTQICRSDADDRCIAPLSGEAVARRIADEVRRLGRRLAARGARLVVMLPIPVYDTPIPDLEIKAAMLENLGLADRAARLRSRVTRSDFALSRDMVRTAAEEVGAAIFDPRADLCDAHGCRFAVDGVALYSDYGHLALSQLGMFRQSMRNTFLLASQPQVGLQSALSR